MITEEGYVIKSEEDYFDEFVESIKAFFPGISENPSNLAMVFGRIVAKNENYRDYDSAKANSNAYVATSYGTALDKAVRTVGISRKSGTRAVGKITITKSEDVSQIVIPANSIVVTSGLQYEIINDNATIISSTTPVEFEIESVEVGSGYNLPIDSTFTMLNTIYGIDEIIGTTSITGGTDKESDVELKIRYFERVNATKNSSLAGVMAAVESVDGVTLVDGFENKSSETVDGLIPHSYIIFAEGGTEDDIANAINSSGPAGIQTNGDIVKTITLSDKDYEIKFSRFTGARVYYDTEIVIDPSVSQSTIITEIKDSLIEYTSLNRNIVSYKLSTYLSQNVDGIVGVKKLYFGTSENPTSGDDLEADLGAKYFTDEDSITLVVV